MMKRSKLMIALLASLMVFLTACGAQSQSKSSTKSSDKVTLDFWTFWGSGDRREVIESIISDYNQSQDKVTVKHIYQPWGDIWTKSLSAITAGNPPDVIVQDIMSVSNELKPNNPLISANILIKRRRNNFIRNFGKRHNIKVVPMDYLLIQIHRSFSIIKNYSVMPD